MDCTVTTAAPAAPAAVPAHSSAISAISAIATISAVSAAKSAAATNHSDMLADRWTSSEHVSLRWICLHPKWHSRPSVEYTCFGYHSISLGIRHINMHR